MRDKTSTREMMGQLNQTFVNWLNDKHQYVNYNEDGQLMNSLPPMLTQYSEQNAFVKEVLQRRQENRKIPYDIQTKDWEMIEEYSRNYTYYLMNGNETTSILGCTNIFRDMVSLFDQRAL